MLSRMKIARRTAGKDCIKVFTMMCSSTLIFFIGHSLMSRWFRLVAKLRSQELFMLNLLLIVLGMAALTEHFGLSLALGAFLAGMLISETPYRHQVEEDVKPFRDVLLGLFFITIGMLLDFKVIGEQWVLVLILLFGPLLFKFGLIALLARFLDQVQVFPLGQAYV